MCSNVTEICGREGCGTYSGSEDWPEPEPLNMAVLIFSWIAYIFYGGYLIAKKRPKWLLLWFPALLLWMTLCKYLICTRCEKYGEPCDFYYLGKWAALLFERQPDKTLDTAGIIAEGSTVATLQLLPIVAGIGSPGMLLKYMLLLAFNQAAQLSICCRKCVQYSTDPWKREVCPSYKQARAIFFRSA